MDKEDKDFVRKTQDIWNENAAFWDNAHGDKGNRFHRTIIEPTVLELLSPKHGETILEIACGNGAFARKMVQLGVNVVATDFSENFLAQAKARTTEHQERINYKLVDATDEKALLALGEQTFDAAVCNMALMDIATIEPLFAALSHLLKPQGRFVFSVQHPCFNSNGVSPSVELQERGGELQTIYSLKVLKYLTPFAERGTGIIGQPSPHYYFHRPLSVLLKAGFRVGFVLEGLEEPVDPAEPDENNWSSWSNYKETPPALVVRLRLLVQ